MAGARPTAFPTVRGFAPRDLSAAAAFCARARALDPAVEPFGARLSDLAADPRALAPLWRVAEDDSGALAGIAFAALRGPGARADVYAAVLPALRRRGLGRVLLAPAIAWAREAARRAPSALRAAVADGPGGAPARAFLAALGFAEGPAHLTLRREGAPPDVPPRPGVAIEAGDPASAADASALRRLASEAWEGDPDAFPDSAVAARRGPARLLLLARGGGATPAGYLAARREGEALIIEEVAVVPGARRRGIGRALVAAALRASRSRTALLAVAEDNRAARGLYEGLGFRRAGRRVAHELRPAPSRAPRPARR